MFRSISTLAAVAVLATVSCATAEPNPPPPVVPALRQWTGAEGTLNAKAAEIVVDAACKATLASAAEQFRADLEAAGLGKHAVRFAAAAQPGHFFLTAARDAALGPEGYKLEIADSATLRADTAAGAVLGTRTLLQMLALDNGACLLPKGAASDFPAVHRRMLLLDVGRKPFPLPALRDFIRMMAWYKMNELHLHLNDEAFGNDYSGFRVQCDTFPGLASKDQAYTKAEIRELQAFARALNVTITPEIDMPGHSQCFTRIWPELAYKGQKNYLDVNNPETVRRLKMLLDEMIPLFDAPDFHIGTDEYRVKASSAEKAKLADDFMRFVNTMAAHVRSKGKTCRMWYGTDHRESKVAPDAAITLDIWNLHSGVAGIARGHMYINSNESVSYIVPGCHYYGVNNGGVYQNWEPWLFGNGPDEETRRDPNLLGAKLHVWNDQGPTGYTVTEIADLSLPSIQVFAEKMWGAKGSPDYAAFQKRAAATLPVPGATIFDRLPAEHDGLMLDLPKEQLLAGADACIPLPLAKAGRADLEYPWTLTVELCKGADTGRRGVILSSELAEVCADFQPGDCPGGKPGKRGIGMVRAASGPGADPASAFLARDVSHSTGVALPAGKWAALAVVAQREKTLFFLDGVKIGETNIQMVCPLRWLGSKTGHSFAGRIRNLKVYNRALAPREIRRAAGLGGNAAASLATDRPATASASDTNHDFVPENATDGDDGTRWCSGDTRDPQWLAVDLGTEQRVGRVAIKWENAFPRAYSIELSTDGQAWKTVFSGAGKPGGTTVAEFAAAPARHVRIRMSDAATQWGYSVWSLDVYPPRK